MSVSIKMSDLKGVLDTVSSWGYRDSKKDDGCISFCVDPPSGYPGEVFVTFRRLDELIVREVRFWVEKTGLELRVTDVPQDKLSTAGI